MFFWFNNNTNKKATNRFNIIKIQLLLKVLLIDSVVLDLKIIKIKVNKAIIKAKKIRFGSIKLLRDKFILN